MIEVIIAAALCLSAVLGIVGAFVMTIRAAQGNLSRIQAAYLEEEGLEAVRTLRDNGWTANIASQPVGSTRYLAWNGATWELSTTNTPIGSYERTVVFDTVYRDGAHNIVSSGTADANTIQRSAERIEEGIEQKRSDDVQWQ